MKQPEAVTFDFFKTLVRPAGGRTRGEAYLSYLASAGLPHAPWEHRMLYDIFAYYSKAYHPSLAADQKQVFWQEFTRRLFEITEVPLTREEEVADHRAAVETIFSSRFFTLFEDVHEVLARLLKRGMKLAVLSNWPGGLHHFCEELGLGGYFHFCLASSDFGREKPDPAIFHEAVLRMGCSHDAVIHVGDSPVDDVEGARRAGLHPVLLDRRGTTENENITIIQTLLQLEKVIFPGCTEGSIP